MAKNIILFPSNLGKECDGKECGDRCTKEGDMAGLCDTHGKCSFDYDNIKIECGKMSCLNTIFRQ